MPETEVFEGVGASITFGTTAVTFDIEEIAGGGDWKKNLIDVSSLSNTAARTKVLEKLKDYENFSIRVHLDPSKVHATAFSSNELITITFPDSLGNIKMYGGVIGVKPGNLTIGGKPTSEISIGITNRNSSTLVETVPAYSVS